ncbi:MAG TPA: hypothetical protein VKZ59_09425, partial [Acidobacteriota bacterium]|nr:hypothetical protein [Acidobacteriota bacterium]
ATAAELDDESLREAETFFLTSTGRREFFDPVQNRGFLEKISSETGGRYYPLSEVEKLPEEIVFTESRSSVVQVLDLWDMPFNFLILLLFACTEWILRKRQGAI